MRATHRSAGCCSPRTPRATSTGRAARRPREDDALARFEQIAAARAARRLRRAGTSSACPAHWSPGLDADATFERARFERRIDTAWRRTSYSALTAAAHDAIVASEPEEAGVTDEPADRRRPHPLGAAALGDGQRPAARHPDPPGAPGARLQRARPDGRAASVARARAVAHRPELLGCAPEVAARGLHLRSPPRLVASLAELALAGVAGARPARRARLRAAAGGRRRPGRAPPVWPTSAGCSTRCCRRMIRLPATRSGCATRSWPRPCAAT